MSSSSSSETYVPQLTEEYIGFFYIIHVSATSSYGEPPK
jgi:hypothetical protein